MVNLAKTERKKLEKAEFYKSTLDKLAYISLIADVSIAAVTLISLHIYSNNVSAVLKWLNYALTGIVAVTVLVFFLFAFESRYHIKILRMLGETGKRATKKMRIRMF